MRNPVFDMMKGLAIIAMIVGHCGIYELNRFLYLWHMPLFFIVSGYFFKERPVWECVKCNLRSLIVPYLISATGLALCFSLQSLLKGNCDIVKYFAAIIVGAESISGFFSEYQIGAIWFLLALFWCRVVYNLLYGALKTPFLCFAYLTISAVATYVGRDFFIPMDLLQGLSAIVFFGVGHEFRKYNLFEYEASKIIICLGGVAVLVSYATGFPLAMAACQYQFYPLNVIGAVFATYFIYRIFLRVNPEYKVFQYMSFCGRISLLVLCVHLFDIKLGLASAFVKHIVSSEIVGRICLVVLHVVVPLTISALLYRIALVKRIFKLM